MAETGETRGAYAQAQARFEKAREKWDAQLPRGPLAGDVPGFRTEDAVEMQAAERELEEAFAAMVEAGRQLGRG